MFKITASNNVNKETGIYDATTTIREVFQKSGIDATKGAVNLNGTPVYDLDQPLSAFGLSEDKTHFLFNVQKTDNA